MQIKIYVSELTSSLLLKNFSFVQTLPLYEINIRNGHPLHPRTYLNRADISRRENHEKWPASNPQKSIPSLSNTLHTVGRDTIIAAVVTSTGPVRLVRFWKLDRARFHAGRPRDNLSRNRMLGSRNWPDNALITGFGACWELERSTEDRGFDRWDSSYDFSRNKRVQGVSLEIDILRRERCTLKFCISRSRFSSSRS